MNQLFSTARFFLKSSHSDSPAAMPQKGQPAHHQPTRALEVYDVTGAGDTVSAALGCGIAAGLSLRDATLLANLAAGVVVGKLGTATASIDDDTQASHEARRDGQPAAAIAGAAACPAPPREPSRPGAAGRPAEKKGRRPLPDGARDWRGSRWGWDQEPRRVLIAKPQRP